MSSNEKRALSNEEIAGVSGANGVIAGPGGEGCTPSPGDILPTLPPIIVFPNPMDTTIN